MNSVAVWAPRLAERLAPGEVALAAQVGLAYVRGGPEREALFSAEGGEPGGFGQGLSPAELPILLDGLRAAAELLHDLLSDGLIGNTLAVYSLIDSRRRDRRAAAAGQSGRPDFVAPGGGEGELLQDAIDVMTARFRVHGWSPEQASEKAYAQVGLLLDAELAEARRLVADLAASEPAGSSPARRRPGWMSPPWLWLYLAGYLVVGLPELVAEWVRRFGEYAALAQPASALLLLGSVSALLPALFLLAGVVSLLFPAARGRYAERGRRGRGGLVVSDDPVVREVEAYVAELAPGVGVRVGIRNDRLARIYPTGWRSARVAVFPPLLRMWQEDREAACAVLLHEVAHVRQRDHLIVGLASPFTRMVGVAGPVLAVAVLLPLAVYVATGSAVFGAELGAEVLLQVSNVVRVLVLPVAALWLAELSADRLAVRELGPEPLLRALASPQRRSWLTHPPASLRRAVVRRRRTGNVLVLLAFPLAWALRLALAALVALPAYLLIGEEPWGSVAARVREALVDGRVQLAAMIVLLLAWPFVTGLRGRRAPLTAYFAAALLPALLYGMALGSDVRWHGRSLPVSARTVEVSSVQVMEGRPEWAAAARQRLGTARWRFEHDGGFTFAPALTRTDLYPLRGTWTRRGDLVQLSASAETGQDATKASAGLLGALDLTKSPPVLSLVWSSASGITPGSAYRAWLVIRFGP
ncbi:M48 family metalloprotease [Nonomuraea sp. NPDC050310]|uniref:M48 family metalloprotease n=1 Tax=Nonomuraea sp. NPDC050310 TaxID=3154935 RepID=UPI0033E3BD2A